jgi:cbb3-type cytochrome oxidase subunit 3
VQVVVMATLFVLLLAYNFLSHKREAAGNAAETV